MQFLVIGLIPLLAVAILLEQLLMAGLTVPPVLGRAVVEDGRPAPMRRTERRTPKPVNQPASGYG